VPFRTLLRFLPSALLLIPSFLAAQLEPPGTGGAVALAQEQRMLGHNRRVLMIGAHPDDEDTELLAVLVRGMGAEAAYLSLNRGEGGQNLIGPELGEALGLLRTEELMAARRLDGARQYFTRAYDFGYSKDLDETWTHWPRDSVLKDVVRIVRRFRPQIIVSVFSGTPKDGHGQHQAAGWAAREAFRVAGDASRFPELATEEGLSAWMPDKLYRSTWFDPSATTLRLDGGGLDQATGKSLHQTAMQGRSLHRSQDMGRLQAIGPSTVQLAILEDRTGAGGEPLFAGVDTTIATAARVGQTMVAEDQQRHRIRAEGARRGVLLDAIADDDRVVAGQALTITALLVNGGARPLPIWDFGRFSIPPGWSEQNRSSTVHAGGSRPVPPGGVDTTVGRFRVAAQAPLTTPYFLALPRAGDLYAWPASAMADWGLPFEAPLVRVRAYLARDMPPLEREASSRTNDQARGEIRRPVTVVPRLDVRLDRDTLLVPTGASRAVRFVVTVTHGAREPTSGQVTLDLPAGWPAVEPRRFSFTREDQRESFEFTARTPAQLAPGSYEVRAVASDAAGARYDVGVYAVDYQHIRARHYIHPAAAALVAAPLVLPRLARVGYVRGAADRVPEALAGVGVPVELVDSVALERGDLSRYDAIVIGPRAYETDPALVEHNGRLLDYARNGGLVIVQYQQYDFVRAALAPYPLTIASPHDRVTDERAPVRILRPGDPAVTAPNALGAADWEGWHQERGLYFARAWDDAYRTVLETHDAGGRELSGGLLIAALGKGTYVYTGIAFFRELPAGVPGAFRLFANLLALPRGPVP
jgi:LmbE family N-acetylglucosaminyl deacetylase